jgi:hypothetical protein
LTYAQEKTPKPSCFKVTSFSSSIGFGGALTSNTDADYYILKNAVENPEFFVDITGYKNNGSSWGFDGMYYNGFGSYGYTTGGSGNGNLLFNLGLTPYSKKLGKYRENRELRFSVGGSLGSRNNFYYYDNNAFVIDTFQSVNGNGRLYADSSITKNYYVTLDFSEVNFGLSYLFKTDVSRRVNFYAGVGANYGIALRSTVSIDENIYRSIYYYNENDQPAEDEYVFYGGYNSYAYSFSTSTTNLKNPMQFVRVFIPFGLNFRISKKPASFFHDVELYTELNPGVEFQILSPEKTYANPYFGVGFIGFRYSW